MGFNWVRWAAVMINSLVCRPLPDRRQVGRQLCCGSHLIGLIGQLGDDHQRLVCPTTRLLALAPFARSGAAESRRRRAGEKHSECWQGGLVQLVWKGFYMAASACHTRTRPPTHPACPPTCRPQCASWRGPGCHPCPPRKPPAHRRSAGSRRLRECTRVGGWCMCAWSILVGA